MKESNIIMFEQKPLPFPKSIAPEVKVPVKAPVDETKFTHSVVFKQSPLWSRAILWGIVGVNSMVVVWANVATIEEAVQTQGMLEPQGAVKEVQTPVGGVVETVYVEDGQRVRRGDLLLRLDSKAVQAQLVPLLKIRTALTQENQFYRSQLANKSTTPQTQELVKEIDLPPGIASLTKSRSALIEENRLYRAQLNGITDFNFSPEEKTRLEFSQAELDSRIASDQWETEQLKRQLKESEAQLSSAQDIQKVSQTIVDSIEPLVQEGAIANVQFLKQQEELRIRQADVERLAQQQQRLRYAIAQSKEKLRNTIAGAKKDILTKIADNEKQIAQIDSELNKAILENEKKIAEVESQISQVKYNLDHQQLRAPSDGVVFDLQARSGSVINPSQELLKIVPNEALIAKVHITNRDIGFLKEGMKVDVRIDSFPFSEFGDIKGELIWIGSDALPPNETRPFYSFPAKIRLESQSLSIHDREVLLQSGMSVSANVKVRDRTVMSIFTDLFAQQIDSLKTAR
jgi:hemolysin D